MTDRLFESAYEDLCRIASGLPRTAGSSDPAALVHEAYLRFRNRRFPTCDDRGRDVEGFVFVMALAMRTVARDRRRRASAVKRGGGSVVVSLDDIGPRSNGPMVTGSQDDLCAVREVMRHLAARHPKWFAVLMHHDYAGRTIRETARRMDIDEGIVRSHRRSGLRWLRAVLSL